MKLSVFGALVLTLLALGANSQILLPNSVITPPPPPHIRNPFPVYEEGYWGDWGNVLSP